MKDVTPRSPSGRCLECPFWASTLGLNDVSDALRKGMILFGNHSQDQTDVYSPAVKDDATHDQILALSLHKSRV